MKSELDNSDIISFGALVALLTWLTFRPVSIPCVNCDTGGLFYKCAEGTGAGSITCDAYLVGEKAIADGTRAVTSVSEYTKDLSLFASKLPEYLADFAASLKMKLLQVGADVYKHLQGVWAIVRKKLEEIRVIIGKPIYDAWNTVYDEVIAPIISSVITYILEPVTKLIDSVAVFAGIVLKEVKKLLGESQDVLKKAYNAVYDASGVVSDTVGKIIVDCANLIEKLVASIRTATNDTLNTVMGGIETSINNVGRAVNTAVDGLEDGVNKVMSATTNTVSSTVNEIGSAIDTVATGTSSTINTSLGKVTTGIQNSVNDVTTGTSTAVNTVGKGMVDTADRVVRETESIINGLSDGLETSVNTLVDVINTNVSGGIETSVNGSAKIVKTAIDTLLKPIKAVVTGINKIPAVNISLGKLGDIKPFSFVPTMRAPNNVTFPTMDIPDIDHIDIPTVTLPSFQYVTPTATATAATKALGRQRILGAIARAQKNWRLAGTETVEEVYYVRKTRNFEFMPANDPDYDVEDEDEDDDLEEMVDTWTAQPRRKLQPLGLSFWNKIGNGLKEAANTVADFAEDTANTVVDGLENAAVAALKPLVKSIQDAQASGAKDAAAKSAKASADAIAQEAAAAASIKAHDSAMATTKANAAAKKRAAAAQAKANKAKMQATRTSKKIDGVTIPSVNMTAPTVNIKAPGLRVDLKAPSVKIARPNMNVKLPRPQVDIKVGDLSADVPKIPNLFDGVAIATAELKKVLSTFFEPVWAAMGTLFAMVNAVIASVIHFFQEELSWTRIKNGVFTVIADARVSMEAKIEWFKNEVAIPLYNVILLIKDKLMEFVWFFVKTAKGLLVNLKGKLYALMDTIYVKVKPVLREAAVIGGGIGMLSLGRLADKLIPLPMAITTKVYTLLTFFIVGLTMYYLSKVKFVCDRLSEIARACMVPFIFADEQFENFVRTSSGPMAASFRTAFGVQ